MSSETLVESFEDLSVKIFQPLLQIVSSVHVNFAEGMRLLLCRRIVDVLVAVSKSVPWRVLRLLTTVCRKLGRELSQEMMISLLQLFFSSFDRTQQQSSNEQS